jgi:hypothetical protein
MVRRERNNKRKMKSTTMEATEEVLAEAFNLRTTSFSSFYDARRHFAEDMKK